MADKKITLRYILAIVIAVVLTWVIHEFAHWLASQLLGYKSIMTLNGTSFDINENPTSWHRTMVSASGPIITILQAYVVFRMLKPDWNKYLYPLLFTPLYMRLLAGLMNFINLNDEGRISAFVGMGTFTLPIIVSGILFIMVYQTSKTHNLSWKFQLGTTIIVMFISSILILTDQFFHIRIL